QTRKIKIRKPDFIQQSRLGIARVLVDRRHAWLQRPLRTQPRPALAEDGAGDLAAEIQIDAANHRALTWLNDDVPGFPTDVFTDLQRHQRREETLSRQGRQSGVVGAPAQTADLTAILILR